MQVNQEAELGCDVASHIRAWAEGALAASLPQAGQWESIAMFMFNSPRFALDGAEFSVFSNYAHCLSYTSRIQSKSNLTHRGSDLLSFSNSVHNF